MTEPATGTEPTGRRIRRHEPTWFDAAAPELFRRAYQAAHRVLRDVGRSEDAAQEALLRAYQRADEIEPYATAWIIRVANNLAIDTLRRERADPAPPRERAGDDACEQLILRHELTSALAELPHVRRDVALRRFVHDEPPALVATAIGTSVSCVLKHTMRARADLRRILSPDDSPGTASDPLEPAR